MGDKFFWGRRRCRRLPQISAILGRREETQSTADVPIEKCLIRGVQSETRVQLGSICCQIGYKTEYYDTEQNQTNQSDRLFSSSLQAGASEAAAFSAVPFNFPKYS